MQYAHAPKNQIPALAAWVYLTLIPLTWRIRWAPNNASKWQMGFNSAHWSPYLTWSSTL